MDRELWDCIIVGGGPAGLSAALVLGRCRRKVLLCDAGKPRNRHAVELHSFITRDGVPPARLLEMARDNLVAYPSVRLRPGSITAARAVDRGFELQTADGALLHCRKLLLATGVRDELPPVAGIEDFYGRSVHHCPYCDGWESRDEAAAHARGHGLAFPAVKDEGHAIADAVGATRTPEALVIDSTARLRYRGRVMSKQESPELKRAIDAVRGGRTMRTPETKAFGCAIGG